MFVDFKTRRGTVMLEGNAWNQGSSLKGLKGAATEGPEYVARGVFESRKTLGSQYHVEQRNLKKYLKNGFV